MHPERDPPSIAIDDGDLRTLLDTIHEIYGYDLRDYTALSMQRRVRTAMISLDAPDIRVLTDQIRGDASYFLRLIETLTVRVTEMFRDPPFFRALRARVMPLLRTYPLLNIWIGGCASGEEAYSTAILFDEEGLGDRIQIYATDLSPQAIQQAKEGIYPDTRLTLFADNYVSAGGMRSFSDYYTAAYDRIALCEAIRRKVVFFEHDLVSDHVFAEMQLIVCRNVMIYFGASLRDRVLRKFHASLCPNGFLGLGSSEGLRGIGRDLFADFVPDDRIYRRMNPGKD
jgi:chemotaxis protein methyltransferase CheR